MNQTILAADPDLSCEILSFLEDQGFSILSAKTFDELLLLGSQLRFDVVLLDPGLPGFAGAAGIETIRQLPGAGGAAVILGAAPQAESARLNPFALQADDYLAKPYEPQALLGRIRFRLRGKAGAPESERFSRAAAELPMAEPRDEARSGDDFFELMQRILCDLTRFKNLERCSVALLEQERSLAYVIASSDAAAPTGWRLDLANYPELREVGRTGHPLIVPNVRQAPIMAPVADRLHSQVFQSLLVIPVLVGGCVVGALVLRFAEPDPEFTQEELFFCRLMALMFAQVIKSSRDLPAMHAMLREENRHLQKKLESRDLFAMRAISAMHTPVTAIHGFCSLIREGGLVRLDADQQDYFTKVIETCEELDKLMGDLLDLSRLMSGKAPLDMAERDLCVIVRKVHEKAWPQALAKGLMFQWDMPPHNCRAWFDAASIQRVLEGLVNNAIRFTPTGGQIRLAVEERDDEIRVHVQDSGVGIAPAQLARLLGECTAETALGENSECGVGISLYRAIIAAHAGRLWAESQPGRGSLFGFSLPKAAIAAR
ncbi:ATP-binding protein [Geoalkalibacter sp.]|uniref:ATP-binding protein n=1 Tax=Geoalkalibacter sp. TaxID=3041440 RepID=UPI00272E0310|nr:ATP-binding protein [Geoalkalibacter sp.]